MFSSASPLSKIAFLIGALFALAPDAKAAVTCSVNAGAVAFGVYDPLSALPDDSGATVAVTCSLTAPDTVVVNFTVAVTTGASGSFSARTLKAGTASLNYNLFIDAARTMVWGDGSGGSSVFYGSVGLGHGLGNNGSQTANFNNYGRIPGGQDVMPGSYGDVLTVSVTW